MTRHSDCARFITLQDRRLAEEEPLGREEEAFLTEHAKRCPSCGLEAATLSVLRRAGDPTPDPALSDALVLRRVDRILAVGSQPRHAAPAWRQWPVGLAVSAAAAAALAVVLFALPSKTQWPLVAPPPRATAGPARLTLISGDVTVGDRPAGAGRRLAVGERLRVGAGRAVLTLADGSSVLLDPHSQVALVHPGEAGSTVHLHQGRALFQVAPQRPGDRFVVITSWGKVQVIGTVFQVASAAPQRVLVAKGEVRVTLPESPAKRLRGGQMLLAGRDVRPLADPRRRALLRRVRSAAHLVAADPAILSVVTHQPGATVALDGVAAGETPLAVCVSPGRHRVTVSRPGFATVVKTVELLVGRRAELNLALTAETGSPAAPTEPPPVAVATAPPRPRPGGVTPPLPKPRQTPVTPPKVMPTVPELEAPTAGQLLRHAAQRRAAGNWRGVVKVYRQLIRLHPSSPEAATSLVLIGQALLRHLGQARAALGYFNAYLGRHSGGALAQEAAWGRLSCLRRLGRKQDEIRACRDLLRRHPQSVYAKRVQTRLTTLLGTSP